MFFSLAAGNVDGLSEHRRKTFFAGTALYLLVAVVDAAIIAAGGGHNAQIVPAAVLIFGGAPAIWYVRLAGTATRGRAP